MNIKIGRKEGWDFSSNGFEIEDIGITKSQKTLFEQTFAFRNYGITGKPVVNFILIYNGTAELTLTEFANTPIGTEIRTPNVEGVYSYYHEKKSNPASANDWAIISKGGGTAGDLRPYKVYTALLTQSGTNAPVITTVFENTIVSDFITGSFVYNSPGVYYIVVKSGIISVPKTVIFINTNKRSRFLSTLDDFIGDTISFYCVNNAGSLIDLSGTSFIEIRVYP